MFASISTRFAHIYKRSAANSDDKLSRQIATTNSCGKFPRQILAANSHGKFLRQILPANSNYKLLRQISTANSVQTMMRSNPLCGKASRVKIKRKPVTKRKLWGLISLISKTNISNISEISFSRKWLKSIVFAVLIIQLPSRKGARYGFNMPNCYLKTKAKYEQDKNIFFGLIE